MKKEKGEKGEKRRERRERKERRERSERAFPQKESEGRLSYQRTTACSARETPVRPAKEHTEIRAEGKSGCELKRPKRRVISSFLA